MKHSRFFLVFLLVIIAISIATRLLPHPPNFTPIAALALFAGVYASRISKWYLLLPLGAMLLSDLFIGFYEWKIMALVYASFLIIAVSGLLIRKYKNFGTVVLGSLGSAILFYLTTNFAVWAFTGMYAPTFEGLMLSYSMALPFFKFTIAGNLVYAGLFFGAYEAALAFAVQRKTAAISY